MFDELNFDTATKSESKFYWIPIGPEMIEQSYFSVTESCVNSQDNLLKPFVIDETRERIFQLKKGSTVGFKDDRAGVLAALTIERDLDLTIIDRQLDNSAAMIAGVLGGFALIVWLFFYTLDWFCTSTKFANYMASELYTVDESVENASM